VDLTRVEAVEAADGVIDDRALAHAVDAAEDVDIGTQLPQDVTSAAPKLLDFNA
jgi:hypothetical protein